MFLNPLWSVLLLAGVIAVYWFIIRPRLKVAFTDTYTHIDSWWARWWARIVAFRSYAATLIAAFLVGLPDILVALVPVDFSPFIGEAWAKMVAGGLAIFLAINSAFKTTRNGTPAP